LLRAESELFNARWNDGERDICLEGTFETILDKIKLWEDDFFEPPLHWFIGLPGTGKSTIIQTILEKQGYVNQEMSQKKMFHFEEKTFRAYFFCSESGANSISNNIIPALAYQLAYVHPEYRTEYLSLVHPVPGGSQYAYIDEPPRVQMEKLLTLPIGLKYKTVIMIDGLDKCQDHGAQFLDALKEYLPLMMNFKFLITASTQPQIELGSLDDRGMIKTTDLANEDQEVKGSIRKFFATKLEEVRHSYELEGGFPTEEELDGLCKLAEVNFSKARGYVKSICRAPYPLERLALILDQGKEPDQGKKLDQGN
jgi:hypothetical protein